MFSYCLFRGCYKGIVVDGDEYLAVVIRYIHLNPVEAGLVREPQAHRWSSHGAYLSRSKAPVWLNVREVLERFKDRREFHEFVLSGNEERIREYYSSQRQSPLLGGEGFLAWVRARREKFSGEHPRYKRVGVRPTVETVVWATLNGHEAGNGGYSQGLA
ncbi:MAG: hypothetical protein IH856_06365 [Deltaproteobacteria bacterium]|nr:hypothetical protein [Deltaproteobacteria bacterium]